MQMRSLQASTLLTLCSLCHQSQYGNPGGLHNCVTAALCCLCSWVLRKYFVGMKNRLAIALAEPSSGGLQHSTGARENAPATGMWTGVTWLLFAFHVLYCFLCQRYALTLFSQPGYLWFSHQDTYFPLTVFLQVIIVMILSTYNTVYLSKQFSYTFTRLYSYFCLRNSYQLYIEFLISS